MKTLILPAEIKNRELDARLLHAALALNSGWRVITGSKALINRNIWRIPAGVYLMTTMTHKRLYMAKMLKKLGFKMIGWDEEGLVYLDTDLYLARRISSETLEYLDQVFTWGKKGADDIDQRSRTTPIAAIGNPRFDVLRPQVRGIYRSQVDEICQRHGDFILINTNFSSINPIISLHDAPERAISTRDKPVGDKVSRQYEGFLDHRQQMFDAFCQMLPELAAAFPDRTIVVRPHPAEETATWQNKFEKFENIKVIRQGASIPWLLASKVLIHNGCTTAIETRLLGNNPIAFAPVSSSQHESPLPNGVSHIVGDSDKLIALVKKALVGNLKQTAVQKKLLDNFVAGQSGPLAAQLAVDYSQKLIDSQVEPAKQNLTLRVFAFGRYLYKSLRRDHRTDRYLKKVFPTTHPDEITTRVNQLASELKLDVAGRIKVRQISRNIFDLSI